MKESQESSESLLSCYEEELKGGQVPQDNQDRAQKNSAFTSEKDLS